MTQAAEFLETFPFDENVLDHNIEKYEQAVLELVKMPSFYSFPSPTPAYKLDIKAKNHIEVYDSTESLVSVDDDLEKSYDSIKEYWHADVEFSGNLELISESQLNSSKLIVLPQKKGESGFRLLTSETDRDRELSAKEQFLTFIRKTKAYEENPNDFFTAYWWLDEHPAFWTKHKIPGSSAVRWDTEYRLRHATVTPYREDSGKVIIGIEFGEAVEPERATHYHDPELDSYAPSYEEAIIILAKNVYKTFNLDGSNTNIKPLLST